MIAALLYVGMELLQDYNNVMMEIQLVEMAVRQAVRLKIVQLYALVVDGLFLKSMESVHHCAEMDF
jgi:hypothetical protein